jgi:hypothetical protein
MNYIDLFKLLNEPGKVKRCYIICEEAELVSQLLHLHSAVDAVLVLTVVCEPLFCKAFM